MPSRRTPRRVGSAIGALADQLAPRTTLAEAQKAWGQIAGPALAKNAEPTSERGGALTITCRSSVWAQELDLMAPELIAKLNARLGEGRVTALRCVAARPRR